MEDIVRVIRVLEYVGPRSWVESIIAHNAVKGVMLVGSKHEGTKGTIREAILGDFPEITSMILKPEE